MTENPRKGPTGENSIGYSRLLAATMDGGWLVDTTGRLLDVNDIYCRMSGYTREELLSLSVSDLDAGTPEETARHTRQIMKTGSLRYETRHRRKDGRIIDVEIAATFQRPSGTIIVFVHDISRRKRAELLLKESEIRYRRLFETAQDGILIIDEGTGKIIDANTFILDMLGYPLSDFIDKELWELGFIGDKSFAQKAFTDLKTNSYIRYDDIPLKTKGGQVVEVEFISNVYMVDHHRVIQCNIRDVTERKRAERALALAGRKLNLMSGITRHDIMNQLTVLSGSLELALDTANGPEWVAHINRAQKAADTIRRQIAFTREYEELGVKAPVWQQVSGIVRSAASQLPSGAIALEVPDDTLELFADPLLGKVFYNLFDNARQHGGGVSRISVSHRAEGTGLIITVEDNGDGISLQDKPHLFERGYGKNTGLGLFLSREILAITGISIRETGIPGKGARFEIQVPEGAFRFPDS